jgi:hypothetical protein
MIEVAVFGESADTRKVTVLESLLCFTTTFSYLSALFSRRRPGFVVWSAAGATTVWAVQLYLEGFEVLLSPVYISLGALALVVLLSYPRRRHFTVPRLVGIFGTLVTVVAGAATFLLSAPPLARPSGSYPVGTSHLRLSENPVTVAKAFYPADLPGAYLPSPSRARLFSEASAAVAEDRIAEALGVPEALLSRVEGTRLWSYPGLRVSRRKDRYPAVVLSPPEPWCHESVFHLAQEIASAGIVVIIRPCDKSVSLDDLVADVRRGVPDGAFAGKIARSRIGIVAIGEAAAEASRVWRTGSSVRALALLAPSLPGTEKAPDSVSVGVGGSPLIVDSTEDLPAYAGRREAGALGEQLTPERFLDLDLLTRVPGMLGIGANRPVRAAAIPLLRSYLLLNLHLE